MACVCVCLLLHYLLHALRVFWRVILEQERMDFFSDTLQKTENKLCQLFGLKEFNLQVPDSAARNYGDDERADTSCGGFDGRMGIQRRGTSDASHPLLQIFRKSDVQVVREISPSAQWYMTW